MREAGPCFTDGAGMQTNPKGLPSCKPWMAEHGKVRDEIKARLDYQVLLIGANVTLTSALSPRCGSSRDTNRELFFLALPLVSVVAGGLFLTQDIVNGTALLSWGSYLSRWRTRQRGLAALGSIFGLGAMFMPALAVLSNYLIALGASPSVAKATRGGELGLLVVDWLVLSVMGLTVWRVQRGYLRITMPPPIRSTARR